MKHLLPLINQRDHTCYVEAFAGSAAMLFERSPAKIEVLILHTRWRCAWMQADASAGFFAGGGDAL